MWACRATLPGKTRRSTPAYGRRRLQARAWCDGSTSTAMDKGTLAGHGGEHRAVFVYQHDSYRYWQNQLGRDDFAYGQFGENFTVDGLSDQEVCIGDRYRIGGALFEVTQPRVTCYRVGIRMNEPRDGGTAGQARQAWLLFPCAGGRRSQRRATRSSQVASAPERMSVSDDRRAALHARPSPRSAGARAAHPGAERRLARVPSGAAASRRAEDGATTGNAGLAAASGPPPAWRGFRPLRVSRKVRESAQRGFAGARARRMGSRWPRLSPASSSCCGSGRHPAPALTRSYSLSGEPGAAHYRVSVKREAHGAAGAYIDDELQVGDMVDASAARGSFTLTAGRHARCLVECRDRGDAGARDASRVGGRSIDAGSLVAVRSPQRPRTSFCRGGAPPARRRFPTATAIFATARPIPRIGPMWISTLAGHLDMRCAPRS